MAIDRLAFVLGGGGVGALLTVGEFLVVTPLVSDRAGTVRLVAGNALPSIGLAPDGVPGACGTGHTLLSLSPVD
jgi:hypothetical protein